MIFKKKQPEPQELQEIKQLLQWVVDNPTASKSNIRAKASQALDLLKVIQNDATQTNR
jgi:hypothetical protein